MPRLSACDPRLHRYETRDGQEFLVNVNTIMEAQGIEFDCPLCLATHPDGIGVHGVIVTFANRGVANHQGSHNDEGLPSRWNVDGTDIENLSLTPSIFLKGKGCGWHGWITNGQTS